jgi:hypothetical protein
MPDDDYRGGAIHRVADQTQLDGVEIDKIIWGVASTLQ